MHRLSAAFIAATVVISTPASAATKIQRLVSPGGIEAWFVQDATVPLVAMEYAFSGGSTQDPADKPGVGNMTAETLDEGAGDLDSKTFHERLERRAIELRFSVTRDYFRGSLRMLKENSDEAFDLLRLSLTAARFDSEPIERVRAQILSNLRRESTNPVSISSRRFWEQAFGTHPYAKPANGTLESVPTIQAADLKAYARRVLAKDTLKVAVVGDIDAASLGKLLDETFGSLPAKADLVPVPDVDVAKPPKRFSETVDVPQTSILFGGPGIRRDDPDFMAAYIVNHILAGGTLSSRLYKEVREKARPRLFGFRIADLDEARIGVCRRHRNTRRQGKRNTGYDLRRDCPNGQRRTDPAGTGRSKIISQGLADARTRHVIENRRRAAAVSDRQSWNRLHREA